ncbi:MAG: RNA-directed DNA polymerase [Sandaracinus sp.]|nr:RNA-directed DNA polymerase [Sandaracinus sp.]MCB9632040.1 RNA-directed DNA polymerase [Sandaracinus sp.]
MWLYHPEGVDPRGTGKAPAAVLPPSPKAASTTGTAGSTTSATTASNNSSSTGGWKPPAERANDGDPFDTAGTLTLTPEQLHERAKKIVPWRTAWIGRVDVIPPASDERTALIDRGLVLRGLLTQEDIDEIHRIGDLWLLHKDADRMASTLAHKSAEAAIQARRRERAERKAQKKAEAAKKKAARDAAVAERRATDLFFLGEGVSSQLHDRRTEIERLETLGLPILATPADVAAHLGVEVPRLRFLAFHQEAAQTTHYVQFEVPKRSGGTRTLAAPKPGIAAAQERILETILAKLPLDEAAHGFVTGRSTVTNARPHQGRDLVINLDLKDFFPSVTFPRVRGLFRSFGYSPAVATILALLCTESPRRELSYDGRSYQVAVGARALPQGACTSPAISNLVARKLDRRLRGLAAKHGLAYTRYADDLTFSADADKRGELGMTLARLRHVIEDEGFALNPKKVRVQRKGGRQTVTGIVVNEPTKLGLPREEVRRLRAILHAAKTTGLQAQNRAGHPDFRAHLAGKIAYLAMIDPARARTLREALAACTG